MQTILVAFSAALATSAPQTLDDYLSIAETHSPTLIAVRHTQQSVMAKADVADAIPDPRLTYGYAFEEVQTRAGPQKQQIGLSQTIPWFGKRRLRAEVAAAEVRAAEHGYEAARLRLRHQIRRAYFETYLLDRTIEVTEENLALLQGFEATARARHRAGGSLAGVLKVQVELGKLDDHLQSLADRRQPLLAALNTMVGLPSDQPLKWPDIMTWNDDEPNGDELLVGLPETSPRLNQLQAESEQATQRVRLSRRDTWPDISVGINYIDTGAALNPSTPGSGDDPVLAMVSLNLPIWIGRDRQRVRAAMWQQEAAVATREDGERKLRVDLKLALYEHRDAARKLELLSETLIPQASQSLNVTEEAYRSGSMGFADLIDAQRLLLELQLSVEQARVDREIALAEIEMLTGVEEEMR